jgi:hypothetical protein
MSTSNRHKRIPQYLELHQGYSTIQQNKQGTHRYVGMVTGFSTKDPTRDAGDIGRALACLRSFHLVALCMRSNTTYAFLLSLPLLYLPLLALSCVTSLALMNISSPFVFLLILSYLSIITYIPSLPYPACAAFISCSSVHHSRYLVSCLP